MIVHALIAEWLGDAGEKLAHVPVPLPTPRWRDEPMRGERRDLLLREGGDRHQRARIESKGTGRASERVDPGSLRRAILPPRPVVRCRTPTVSRPFPMQMLVLGDCGRMPWPGFP